MIHPKSQLKALAAALLGGTALTIALPQSEAQADCVPSLNGAVLTFDCIKETKNFPPFTLPIGAVGVTSAVVNLGADGKAASIINEAVTAPTLGKIPISPFDAIAITSGSAPGNFIKVDTKNLGVPSTITGRATGINLRTTGGADILIGQNSAGGAGLNANVTGQNGVGIDAEACDCAGVGGNVSITTAAGTTITGTGPDNPAIFVRVNNGSANVAVNGTATTTSDTPSVRVISDGTGNINIGGSGNTAQGIGAFSFGTGAITIGGTGSIINGNNGATPPGTGLLFAQILNAQNNSDITITRSGVVSVQENQAGIFAMTAGTGNISITGTGNVTAGLIGITAQASGGNVTIAPAGSVTGGNGGIIATTTGAGGVSITTAAGTTVAASGFPAIFAQVQNGSANVVVNGTATTTSGAPGSFPSVFVTSLGSGNINIGGTGNIAQGIFAGSFGTGPITIGGTGSIVNGLNGPGPIGPLLSAQIFNPANNSDITITRSGVVSVQANHAGIFARTAGTGNISITGTGNVTAGLIGITASANGGNVTIAPAGSVTGSNGIVASATGAGGVSITTAQGTTITGTGAPAIFVQVQNGAVNLVVNGTATNPIFAGYSVAVVSAGSGNINIAGTGNIAQGILARSRGTGTGAITIGGTGSIVNGLNGAAPNGLLRAQILNPANNSGINITRSGVVSVQANQAGIFATTAGAGNISITGTGNVTAGLAGITANASGGNVTIAPAGSVTGSEGIAAKTTGAGNINITTAGNITGRDGFGIRTTVATGTITINVGPSSTIFGPRGPLSLTGTSIVNNAGTLRVGAGGSISNKLSSLFNSGNLIVDAGGRVTVGGVTNNAAGVITNRGEITDALNNFGLVNNNGTYTDSVNNFSTGTINNNGIWNGSLLSNLGVITNGGFWNAATFTNNAGGRVTTTRTLAASTSISNDGIFNAQGTLTAPVLTNTGIFNVTGPLAGMVTTFNNAGTVSLINGSATDILKTTNFNSLGGKLAIDVNAAAGKADELVATNLTGTTTLKINFIGNNVFIKSPIPILVATNVDPNTVVISNISGPSSLFGYQIKQDGPTFNLISNLNTSAAGATPAGFHAILTTLNTGFFSGNFVQNGSAFLGEPPDPVPNQINGGPWIRFAGGQNDVRATTSAQNFTSVSTAPSKVRTNFNGFQAGLDLGVANVENTGWNTHLGVTGGLVAFTTNDLLLSGVGSSNQVPFMGIYGAVSGHGFFADFQVRKDFYDMQLNNAAANLAGTNLRGRALSANGTAGYQFDLPQSWFIEPSGALVYSQLHVDTLLIDPANAVQLDFNPVNTLLGRLSLRAGTTYVCEPLQLALQPFGSASVWHEFEGSTRTNFVSGDVSVPLAVTPIGTFGQLGLGMSAQVVKTGLLGFARADWRFGENISGYSVVGGLRYQF